MRVQNVSITMQRAPERPQRTPRFLPALLRIDADAVHIGAADITLLSGRIVPLRNIEGNASVLPKQIRIRQARADHELLHYEASGHVNAARPLGLDGDAEISWSIAGQPDWLIFTHFDGDLDKLPLTGRIQKPFHADIEGAATDLARGWKFAGHTKVRDFDLQKFGGGKALGIISGELDVAAAGEGFSAKGLLTPPGLKAGAFGVDFHGSYSQKVVTIQRTTITHAPSGARATVQGTATIVKGGPELDLAGSWTSFRWPLPAAEPAFASPRGNYTLGGVKPWSVQVDGDVIAAGQPEMPAKMRGLLAGDSLRIDDAEVQVLGGAAKFTGEVHWQPAESWRVAGRMTDLDAARLRPDLPGQLSFDFKASGAPFGATGSMDLEAQNLAGKLRGRNISGKGQFARAASSSDWKFRGVDVSLARTRLQLEGGFGVQSDLSFVIDSDDLSLFDPEARGRISARGRYAGTRETPQLQFKGRGTDFEWKGSKLAALDADVDMDLGVNGHARGQVDLSGLVIGSRTLQKASVQLTGTGQQQRLAVNVEAAPVRSTLVAQGGMQAGLWQGTLQALTIDDNLDLHLALEAPASLALNLQQQQLGQTCLKGAEERLCITGQRQPDGMWTANLAADSVPLHAFTAGLTQNTDYEGTLSLQAELAGHNADLPTGTFRGLLQKAELRHRLTNKRVETMSLGTGSITGNATTTGFAMQVNLDAGASGSIKGDLSGERNAGRWQDYPIKGSLDASSDAALPMLDIYVGGIDKATGRAVARIGITGTLGAPTLQGLLQLRDASIDIYQFNTLLRDLSVDATFNSNSLDIEGSSRLGKGTAKISGNLSWKDREPYGNLHVEGENLRVVDVPEARIDASPNLDFRIAGRSIDATGEVRIPYAQLNPADLTNVVLASSDARLKDATVIDPAQRWVVVSRITMTLGDESEPQCAGPAGQTRRQHRRAHGRVAEQPRPGLPEHHRRQVRHPWQAAGHRTRPPDLRRAAERSRHRPEGAESLSGRHGRRERARPAAQAHHDILLGAGHPAQPDRITARRRWFAGKRAEQQSFRRRP